MKKIGIMGGTFNPIHIGHLILAEAAYSQYQLDMVWFMPSKRPPHKMEETVLPDFYRTEMVKLAIDGNPHFTLSTIELEREGPTYTVDTLTKLKEVHPDTIYYFIIGGDSLYQFETWREPGKILKLTKVIAASRYHMDAEAVKNQIAYLNQIYGGSISMLHVPAIDISSKMIREYRQQGKTIKYFTRDSVVHYIEKNNLYPPIANENEKESKKGK